MIKLKKNSNEKYIKLLNKGNNFYLYNNEIITNIYYGEKEIYKLSPYDNDEKKITFGGAYNVLFDTIYPVDVERYIFKTGRLDLIDVDNHNFDLTTAFYIYLCWYQLFGYTAEFKEEFITEEDRLNGIAEEKRHFFQLCFQGYTEQFLKYAAPNDLNKRIVIYKRFYNSKIDKVIEPLIKKIEKSKILFNYLKGKEIYQVFDNKITNYEFLKKHIFVPKKYEYTESKLHQYDFKIWVKSVNIINNDVVNGNIAELHITLGNKGYGFKESGFKICLLINSVQALKPKILDNNFEIMELPINDVISNQDISITAQRFLFQFTNVFIGIVKLNNNNQIIDFIKLNNKNYEDDGIILIK